VYDVKGFDIIYGKHWVRDINRTYHIDHRINKIWITQGDIPWEDKDKAAQIHYLRCLRADSKPDDDTINEAARTMYIEIIGQKHPHHMSHRLLARVFMVRVQYDNPEPVQPPDKFQIILHNFEPCGLFAEPMYNTNCSKPQFKIDISPEDDKKVPY
jgi:hypothetical protein